MRKDGTPREQKTGVRQEKKGKGGGRGREIVVG